MEKQTALNTPSPPENPAIAVADGQADNFRVEALPRALGGPVASGNIRLSTADFRVEEILPFEPEGEGEHLFLFVEKEDENTADVALRLANAAKVRRMDVGYAGLKDRHAITRQWFSIYLPGRKDPDFIDKLPDSIRILKQSRHNRKLRRGALDGNRFEIVVRNLALYDDQGIDRVEETLNRIRTHGFPNYFGEQRFGRGHGNLRKAIAVLERGKTRKAKEGLYLSAVRSMLFNRVLARRIENDSWNSALRGDVMQIAGSNSLFVADTVDDAILQRLSDHNIHPTAPLCGRNARIEPELDALELENDVLQDYGFWIDGLNRCRVDADRRQLRATVENLEWSISENSLSLRFALPKGSYATGLLRELLGEIVEDQGNAE